MCHITYTFLLCVLSSTAHSSPPRLGRWPIIVTATLLNLDLCLVRPVWDSLGKSSTEKMTVWVLLLKTHGNIEKKKKNYFYGIICDKKRSIFTNIILLFSIFKLTLYCCILSFIAVVLQHCNLMRCSILCSDDLILAFVIIN